MDKLKRQATVKMTMSFFKHLGTKASKFQFHIWIDNVVGVYPSNYSTAEHSTEGIYVILKRRNKSYRTKIALPENGGHIHMNDCIKFTSTLYQKKKKNDDIHLLLPKPFTLRVCNGSNNKIRWESNIDLSDYASVFGVDAHESFVLQFVYKSSKNKVRRNSSAGIPPEITVRMRIKSIWLAHIDRVSQASTGSVSGISSSMHSDLSDISNYLLYDSINQNLKQNDVNLYNEEHKHNYHNVLFTSLPEEHSIQNSPVKYKKQASITPKPSTTNSIDADNVSTSTSSKDTSTGRKVSALASFTQQFISAPSSSSFSKGRRPSFASDDSLVYAQHRLRNLSFITSPTPVTPQTEFETTDDGKERKLSSVSSQPLTISLSRVDGSNATFMLENELMRSSQNDKIININAKIALMLNVCINEMDHVAIDKRIWNNLIPVHCAIVFRSFIHWDVFEENEENTHLILDAYIDAVSSVMKRHEKNDVEQSYWLLRLTTMIYWIHVYFPQKLSVEKTPEFRRHETFESILSNDDDDDDDVIFVNRTQSIDRYSHISNDYYVEHGINSDNHTVESFPIERTSDTSNTGATYVDITSTQPISSDDNKESGVNIPYSFVEQLTNLSHICFNNMTDTALIKLSRIPFEHVFDENEFGETGSNTMDMIFAVMNSIWLLYDANVKIFDVYKVQICQQILRYAVYNGLVNNLLRNVSYCSIAGGFRLKVVRSMIVDWCQTHDINYGVFLDVVSLLDELSSLLLTCAVINDGKELLNICPSLSAAQINQILNNYNAEASNEPLSAEVLTPILEIASSQLPPNEKRLSIHDMDFSKGTMKAFDINNVPLPTISLCDVPTPYSISQHSEFTFLMNTCDNIVL